MELDEVCGGVGLGVWWSWMRCVVELDEVCGGVRCVVELDDYTFNMHLCGIFYFSWHVHHI